MENVKCLILLSGKRFAGKDKIGLLLEKIIKEKTVYDSKFYQVTTEIKRDYAAYANLDFEKLQFDREYKEKHREKMIEYSTPKLEGAYYNKLFTKNILEKTEKPTVYVVPIRFRFEIKYYQTLGIRIILVRINVDDEVKKRRGWVYNSLVDSDGSETDLDEYEIWDFEFYNNTDGDEIIIKFSNEAIIPEMERTAN